MISAAIIIGAGLTSWFLTGVLRDFAIRQDLLDRPNKRSSHSSPVPRGGGLAIILTSFAFLFTYAAVVDGTINSSMPRSLCYGGAIVVFVGFLDDFNHMPAKWRFIAHLGAATIALSLLQSIPGITVFGQDLGTGVFGYAFLAISLVWFVNMFNFMDGIDGIASVETITVLFGAALILILQGDKTWVMTFGILVFSTAGFLVWNWSPAKIFMGDACSGFLGFMLGLFAVVTSVESTINLWTWLILCGVFLIDATTTLVTRITGGAKWYEAHRSHAYQILSRRYGSHATVTIGVAIINLLWLLPFAYLSAIYPYWALPICIAALLPLLVTAIRVGAGKPESRASTN